MYPLSIIMLLIAPLIFLLSICHTTSASGISFKGIPAAFGDLDLNKRTDVVVIGDDGRRIDIYYQHQRQLLPPLELGFSCRTDKPVIQVYLSDIDSDGIPNLLPLLIEKREEHIYHLKSLKVKPRDLDLPYITSTKLTPNTAYSLATAAALNSETSSNISNRTLSEAQPISTIGECDLADLGVVMTAQPLLFDLDGDLRTDFMSLDENRRVTVWQPPTIVNHGDPIPPFKRSTEDWNFIPREYFEGAHANSFIDINHDNAADIVLSTSTTAKVAYLLSHPDPKKSFKNLKLFELDDKQYDYGQSTLVDIDADSRIDHILPRCDKSHTRTCEIIVLFDNAHKEVIFKFENMTSSKTFYNYQLNKETFAKDYEFPITLRASDLDGDGYTDFVVVARNKIDSKNSVVYLHNIPAPKAPKTNSDISGVKTMSRTFEVFEITSPATSKQEIALVTLFDINEDGKVDMLIGFSESRDKPSDMNVTAKMNTQMVDACFMKVLVTNGYCPVDAGSNGQSARGPFICFELSQNDGQKMQGCAGQLSQSSHFALQQPYVIFGLGQTPHFVETLNVSIPGFGQDGRVRTRLLEQIVPDAQVIIIPRQRDNPNSWDYKMFLSPMSDLVFSTLIALAVLCLIILFIIFILHRQETLEDAAEHEEYKRHWPESR